MAEVFVEQPQASPGSANKIVDVVNKTVNVINQTVNVVNKKVNVINRTVNVINKTVNVINKTKLCKYCAAHLYFILGDHI